MYPTHNDLMEFLNLLDYPDCQEGVCFGLSATAIAPSILGSTQITNERLQKIKKYLELYKNRGKAVLPHFAPAQPYQKLNQMALKEWLYTTALMADEIADILAYCQSIAFRQNPDKYKEWFESPELAEQNFLSTNTIIESIEATERGGTVFAGLTTSCLSGQRQANHSIQQLLMTLEMMGQDHSTPPFACMLYIGIHVIHFAYCAQKREWCYFKINQKTTGFGYTSDREDMRKLIYSEFFKEFKTKGSNSIVYHLEFYCLNKNKEDVINLCNAYKQARIGFDLAQTYPDPSVFEALNIHLAKQFIFCNKGDEAIASIQRIRPNFRYDACAHIRKNIPILLLYQAYDTRNISMIKALSLIGFDIPSQSDIEFTLEKYLNFFIEQQQKDPHFVLFPNIARELELQINMRPITEENKVSLLMKYILLRENETRVTKKEHNSIWAQFFTPASSYQEKLAAAKSLLEDPATAQKSCPAFQSGRLGRIAAFFFSQPIVQSPNKLPILF